MKKILPATIAALLLFLAATYAFADSGVLRVPESVLSIEEEAFSGSGAIELLQLDGDTYVASKAFRDCKKLKTVIVYGEDAAFASDAFDGCDIDVIYAKENSAVWAYANKNRIDVYPVSKSYAYGDYTLRLSELGGFAVCGYSGVDANLTIPSEYRGLPVLEIADDAFRNSGVLLSVTVPGSVKRIGNGAFSGGLQLNEVVLSEGLEYMGSGAFASCRYISSIRLPSTLTGMGENPFEHCSHLSEILISDGNDRYRLSGGALIDDKNKKLVHYPCASAAKTLTVPKGVTTIGKKAFWRTAALEQVILPETLTAIEDYAFYESCALKTVNIPLGVTVIGNHAFSGCDRLKEISLPASVKKIGDYAFKNCLSLGTLEIPDGCQHIGKEIFFRDVPVSGTVMNIFPLYQFDYRETVCVIDGEPKSVETSGCGATSMSMVIRYLTGNRDQTPYTLFKWAYDKGYYKGSGLGHGTVTKLGDRYGVTTTWTTSSSKVKNALKNGYPVIAHMSQGTFTDGGHYIVLRGIDEDGNILVNDPNSRERTETAYPFSLIYEEAKSGFAICKKAP